jgi:uncharacterized SAM-binding protein YcdF (DUF218 family)
MDIILHLGGNPQRAYTAAELAQAFPDAKVVVSSELGDFQQIYNSYNISPERIMIDMEAWDTVTNFTHTYKLLQSMGCDRLFVVTDQFHTYRSMLIALCVWGGRVPIYICPHSHSIVKSDEDLGPWNLVRALLWRLTGIFLYEEKVKKDRSAYFTPSSGHSKLEIGI